jgi:hypothetical protein
MAQADTKISQEVAFQSHELTRSMKNDGVAMKTVSEQWPLVLKILTRKY